MPNIPHYPDDKDAHGTRILFERRAHNNRRPIDKLPDELLTYIFLIAKDLTCSVWNKYRSQYTLLQDIVVQVSSRWRQAAISNPALWSYIRITNARWGNITSLWISRAGRNSLLDIDIEILHTYCQSMDFGPSNWEVSEEIITQIFGYLSQNGVSPRRWRSLSFSTFQPEPLFKLIFLLNQEPAPNLHHLCLTVDSQLSGDHSAEARCPTDTHYRGAYSLSENAVPGLRHAELTYVSWKYVFAIDRPTPLLTGLTTLKLTAGHEHPRSLDQIHNLLSANPRLELLELNIGRADRGYISLSNGQRLNPVHLWCLRELSLNGYDRFSWVWDIISIVNAPFVESLSLGGNSWKNTADLAKLFDYIITGRLPGSDSPSDPSARRLELANQIDNIITGNFRGNDSPSNPSMNKPRFAPIHKLDASHKPLFPLTRELDISRLFNSNIDYIISVIPSFSSVTHLSIYCPDARQILSGVRHALPHLETLSLTCVASNPHNCLQKIDKILYLRKRIGSPVRVYHPLKPPKRAPRKSGSNTSLKAAAPNDITKGDDGLCLYGALNQLFYNRYLVNPCSSS